MWFKYIFICYVTQKYPVYEYINGTCVLCIDGELYTWGSNEYGQLGLGLGPVNISKPTLVKALIGLPISFIASGGYHNFVVSKSGKISI